MAMQKSILSYVSVCVSVRVLCTHCQKQLNVFESSMRWIKKSQVFSGLTNHFMHTHTLTVVCSIHFAKSHRQSSNPFIANYQIYRLPLKTIKILSSYLRFWFLIEHTGLFILGLTSASKRLHTHTHTHTFPLLFELLFNFTALLCTSFWFLGKTIYVNRFKAK